MASNLWQPDRVLNIYQYLQAESYDSWCDKHQRLPICHDPGSSPKHTIFAFSEFNWYY